MEKTALTKQFDSNIERLDSEGMFKAPMEISDQEFFPTPHEHDVLSSDDFEAVKPQNIPTRINPPLTEMPQKTPYNKQISVRKASRDGLPAQIKAAFEIDKASVEKLPKPLRDLFLLQEFNEYDTLDTNQMEFTLEMIASYVKEAHPDFL